MSYFKEMDMEIATYDDKMKALFELEAYDKK